MSPDNVVLPVLDIICRFVHDQIFLKSLFLSASMLLLVVLVRRRVAGMNWYVLVLDQKMLYKLLNYGNFYKCTLAIHLEPETIAK